MPMTSQGAARRRFAKTGVGVGGVLMTLRSQATCVGMPVATSGYQSYVNGGCVMNSHISKAPQGGRGNLPSYWAGANCAWPSTPMTTTMSRNGMRDCRTYPFYLVFGPSNKAPYQIKTYKNGVLISTTDMTLNDVVSGLANAAEGSTFSQECVAAWLNAKTNAISIYLPMATIVAMFKGCVNGSGYTLPSGAVWSKETSRIYLTGTRSA